MASFLQTLSILPMLLAIAHTQGVIISAQGTTNSVPGLPLGISDPTTDANIINTSEITSNVVNECGRTLLGGNIDIGENEENQLANKTVTSVTKGGSVTVSIAQGSVDGKGPYTCDLDPTGNADGATGQLNLSVQETDSADGNITLSLTMPDDLACVGASTGNICTIRCFNTAANGPFGGCFAVQQSDIQGTVNDANTIQTAQTLDGILAQVASNQAALPKAVKANQDAKSGTEAEQGVLAVKEIVGTETTTVGNEAASTSTSSIASTKTGSSKKGKGKGKSGRAFQA